MKILNFINMTINTKNDNFNYLEIFLKKIEILQIILQIYNGDPIKAVQNLNSIYYDYQQYLTTQNKNINMSDINKKGYKKISNFENKKNEMDNIPKNQIIITKKNIRNLHIITYYLISFILILTSFLGSYGGMVYMWKKHSSRTLNLNALIEKDFALEYSLYKAINIYDLMIFNNYTIDELSQNIFKESDSNQNNGDYLVKSFYEDLQYAFNSKKEKNKLDKIYDDFENLSNFTCEFLYEINDDFINLLENNSEIKKINDIREILIKICNKTRVDESNDIIYYS